MARLYRRRAGDRLPEGRHQRPCDPRAPTVNPELRGTKCAIWYQLEIPAGGTVELRLRLRPRRPGAKTGAAFGRNFERVMADREPRRTSSTPN